MGSIILARRLSEQPGLGPPQKIVNSNFSSPQFDKPYGVGKVLISETEVCCVSRIGQKIKTDSSIKILPENLETFR